jgi:phosphate transport system protein
MSDSQYSGPANSGAGASGGGGASDFRANPHTVRAYGDELNQLTAEVTRLGGLCESQVADAVESVARRDVALARQVIERDLKLDDLQREIERRAIRLIALRQPVAADLRRTVAAMKISLSLERTGDMAKGIAKRGLVLAEGEPMLPLTRSFERMGKLVSVRLKDVLDAYTTADVDRAMNVWSHDDEVDEHYDSLFRELLTYMMADPRTITGCAHLLFMAKNLERIGDHATNLAEIIHYEITGEDVLTDRPRRPAPYAEQPS